MNYKKPIAQDPAHSYLVHIGYTFFSSPAKAAGLYCRRTPEEQAKWGSLQNSIGWAGLTGLGSVWKTGEDLFCRLDTQAPPTWGQGRKQPFLFSPGSPAECPHYAQRWCKPSCWIGSCSPSSLRIWVTHYRRLHWSCPRRTHALLELKRWRQWHWLSGSLHWLFWWK